jgi:selenide,water dikinase
MTAALKRREATENDILEATTSMSTLNNILDYLSDDVTEAIHAATDITGFGLSGHSMQLAKASNVSLQLQFEALPKFSGILDYLEKGFLTKAHRSNALYTEADVNSEKLSALQRLLINDPQTSGGLLLSVRKDKAAELVKQLQNSFTKTAIIGEVVPRNNSWVNIV